MQFKFFSIKEISDFIDKNRLFINKKFGQNFLINSGVVDTIVNSAGIEKDDCLFEIGSGLGSLTHRILEKECALYSFEIDRAYIKHLKELFGDNKNFHLIEGDFLKTFGVMLSKTDLSVYKKIVFLGNLPYYITTPIIDKIFKSKVDFSAIIFMVQKEVGERIIAVPGTKKYGSLSIFSQYYSTPSIIAEIAPNSFYPRPKVNSALVRFSKKENRITADNEELFFKIVKSIFVTRRKQIKNNLTVAPFLKEIDKEKIFCALKDSGIPLTVRGEVLSIEQIMLFANNLNKII